MEGNETSVFFFLPTAMARRSLPAETSEKVGAGTVRRGSERGARTRAGEVLEDRDFGGERRQVQEMAPGLGSRQRLECHNGE